MLEVERAGPADLEQLLGIAAARRTAYGGYQPTFWRPARDAVERQRAYFTSILDDEEVLVLTAREDGADVRGAVVRGFAIGRLVPAPPVYDPGGVTCVVDDFAVADPQEWATVGHLLLGAVREWATSCGAAQLVVVTAHLDEPKRAALDSSGLTLASEWWVGGVD